MAKTTKKSIANVGTLTIDDFSAEIIDEMEDAINIALRSIGTNAEGHAKQILTEEVYKGEKEYQLTGYLRNSITFALAGENANIDTYKTKKDSPVQRTGTYSGTAPNTEKHAVYIGTNVEYAAGIELGTHRRAGAVHFLHDAMSNNDYIAEYKALLEKKLKST